MRGALLALLALVGCTDGPAVVVVGGGPAGLAAAVEAARGGAEVTLLEGEPELGGAARWAAGITWVPSAAEVRAWEDAAGAPSAARDRYVGRVRPDVVEGLGVAFRPVPDPSGEGATLVAPAGGGRGLVSALAAAAGAAGVDVRTGCRVEGLARAEDGWAVDAGTCGVHAGDRVVLATGGFMGDLEEARKRLGLGATPLLRSAPEHADGNGLALARGAGAAVPDRQPGVIYAHAVPAPHDASVALMVVQVPRDAVVVDTTGARRAGLLAVRGEAGRALLDLPGRRAWLIGTAGSLGRRQAMPLEGPPVPLSSVARIHGSQAADLPALAQALGMLPGALDALAFAPGAAPGPERPLPPRGPFIAVPLLPAPAKSLGGVATDADGRALDPSGAPVPGLYLAGELIGFGDPYGVAPRDSTMVAGAVLSGQAAGRVAASGP